MLRKIRLGLPCQSADGTLTAKGSMSISWKSGVSQSSNSPPTGEGGVLERRTEDRDGTDSGVVVVNECA